MIKESNFTNPANIHFDSSSRTDKGVHSVANIMSFKVEKNGDDNLAIQLKEVLNTPSEESGDSNLKVFHLSPVSRKFSARSITLIRGYEYIIPFDVFLELFLKFDQSREKLRELLHESSLFDIDSSLPTIFSETEKMKLATTISTKLNKILNQYQGHFSFHNFTTTPKATPQPQGKSEPHFRDIFHCYSKAVIVHVKDTHQVAIRIKISGNGFLQHQIRKMISMAVTNLVVPETIDQEYLDIALKSKETLLINKVPGELLILTKSSLLDPEMESEFIHHCREQQIEYKNNIIYPKIFNTHLGLIEEQCEKYGKEIVEYGSMWMEQKNKVKQAATEFIEKERELSVLKKAKELEKRRYHSLNDNLTDRILPNGYRIHFYVKFKLLPTDEKAMTTLETLEKWIVEKKVEISSDFELLDQVVVSEGLIDPDSIKRDEDL